MKTILLIVVSAFILIGCGGKKSPKNEDLQVNRQENRVIQKNDKPDSLPGNENFRIEYFKNNGNVRFYDSQGVEKLTCNTDSEGISFSLKPIVWENMGKIEYNSISVNFEGDLKPDIITFQFTEGEKMKCHIVPKNVSLLSEGKSVSKMTYDIDLKPKSPQEDRDSLLNYLSTKQIHKIILEDTKDNKRTVQGVSNPKFFIEFFKSLEKFSINPQ